MRTRRALALAFLATALIACDSDGDDDLTTLTEPEPSVVDPVAPPTEPEPSVVDPVAPPTEPSTAGTAAPPAEPASDYSLWLSSTQVPTGSVEIVAALVSHTGRQEVFGIAASVQRWDGQAWLPHREVAMCMDHWFCTAPLEPAGANLTIQDIGLVPVMGSAGPLERFSTDRLETGWYRFVHVSNEGSVAAGLLQVVDGAPVPVPLVALDVPAISVDPVVSADGATVQLHPLIPSPSGSQSSGDVEQAVSGLSETAAIERWDSSGWLPVAEVTLETAGSGDLSIARTAVLPSLPDGAYRLVRTGPNGTHTGSFWIASI